VDAGARSSALHTFQLESGELRSNLHRGCTAQLAKIMPHGQATAVKAAKVMKLNMAVEQDIPMLLCSTRGAPRFDELSIRAGVKGILNVTRALEMLSKKRGGFFTETLAAEPTTDPMGEQPIT
jgi:hypothetical protein